MRTPVLLSLLTRIRKRARVCPLVGAQLVVKLLAASQPAVAKDKIVTAEHFITDVSEVIYYLYLGIFGEEYYICYSEVPST